MKEIVWLNHVFAYDNDGHSLNDYNITIFSGEIVCIYGGHGNGKRVVQGILLGEIPVISGGLFINETKVENNAFEAHKSGIVAIDSRQRLIPRLTIYENLFAVKQKQNMFSIFNSETAKQQSISYLKRLDMSHVAKKKAYELTLFEEHMISIAKAMINGVKLIIFNCTEHYYGEFEMNKMLSVMKNLTQEGISILILCEKQNIMMSKADRIQYIQDGKDLFIFDNKHVLSEGLFKNNGINLHKVSTAKKQIIGFTDLMLSSIQDYSDYWDLLQNMSKRFNKCFKNLELGKNAYIIPENSVQSLMPTLKIEHNVSLYINKKISRLGFILKPVVNYVMNEFYSTTGIGTEKKEIDELTNFEKKLVSIYRYVLLRPKFLILENPFFGLDDYGCRRLSEFLIHLADLNIMPILFSNSLEELQNVCTEIHITENGKMIRTKKTTIN